ncbi:MAG: glycosyltransferase [Candidatus Doudnabacteria bacterium]|nr:glycosyltransferase [Candidatus Doudnabacteria bacterium]
MNKTATTVLFLSGREPSYTRNSVILNALKKNYDVIDISSSSKSYLVRYVKILFKYIMNRRDYDLVYIGFYGQPLVLLIRFFTKKFIIFDAFISTYQTLCFDRKTFKPNSIIGRAAFILDKYACLLSDVVLLDTKAHIEYFVRTYKLDENKFRRVFVGADESLFKPKENDLVEQQLVFFYGEYQPLHGIDVIVKAAKILSNEKVRFRIIGKGIEKNRVVMLAKSIQADNVQFIDWVPYQQLPLEISKADICIGGHLGITQKAGMVIAGKTFQFVAMRKPTLVALNKANQELFGMEPKPYFIKPGDPDDLAENILKIIKNKELKTQIINDQAEAYSKLASNNAISRSISAI